MNKRLLYGAFLCFIASASWGAMFPVAHHSFQYIHPFYFTILRYIPVAIILMVILWLKEGKQAFKTEGRGLILWLFGTMGFTIYNLFIFWGQDALGESGVLLASIMEAMMPMIAMLIVWVFLRKKPSLHSFICIAAAFIGVVLVITNGDLTRLLTDMNQLVPILALLISVIGWVLYTMGGGRFPDWSALRYSALSCLYGIITATVIVIAVTAFGVIEVPTVAELHAVKWDIAFMVIFPGLIALLGWNVGVHILKPINSLLFINFVPITTVVITFIQGRALTAYDVIGVLLVIAALTANYVFSRWRLNISIQLESRTSTTKYRVEA